MRIASLLLVFASVSAFAQQTKLMSGMATITNGITFRYQAMLIPGGPSGTTYKIGGGVITARDRVKRFVVDEDSYYGYDVLPEAAGEGRVRVTFSPLSATAADVVMKKDRPLRQIALARVPEPVLVSPGESISVDLLYNAATGQKVVDIITFESRAARPAPEVAGEAADWGMRLVQPVLRTTTGETRYRQTLTGQLVTIRVPDRGQITLSLMPLAGQAYQRVGGVDGTVMRFDWNGPVELRSTENIVPGGGRWNLYGRAVMKKVTSVELMTGDL